MELEINNIFKRLKLQMREIIQESVQTQFRLLATKGLSKKEFEDLQEAVDDLWKDTVEKLKKEIIWTEPENTLKRLTKQSSQFKADMSKDADQIKKVSKEQEMALEKLQKDPIVQDSKDVFQQLSKKKNRLSIELKTALIYVNAIEEIAKILLCKYRHENLNLQRDYDQRYGLILFKPLSRSLTPDLPYPIQLTLRHP
jgi:hypothetical protein